MARLHWIYLFARLDYIGKGLSVQMIQEFILSQFSDKKIVLIDPELSNNRAIHVYKKVGFEIIGEFIASWHPVPHYKMRLNVDDLKVDRFIRVVPYDPRWPIQFESEARVIKKALGDNCVDVQHMGSTSVPGLAAKPVIDMIPVVWDIMKVDKDTAAMQALGYEAKGEYGIPFRRYFQKQGNQEHIIFTSLRQAILRLNGI